MAEPWTRRQFASLVAVGSVLSGTVLPAADPPKSEKKPAEGTQPPVVVTPIDSIIDLVKHQFPHPRLDDVALEEVRVDVRQHLGRSKVLSSYPLINANEPGFVFSAWRADRVHV